VAQLHACACPANAARHAAPRLRYLIYVCFDGAPLCGGLGDRMRGMMYSLRAAIYLHRCVYAAKQRGTPAPFFVPACRAGLGLGLGLANPNPFLYLLVELLGTHTGAGLALCLAV
jgi:hypothetical protein